MSDTITSSNGALFTAPNGLHIKQGAPMTRADMVEIPFTDYAFVRYHGLSFRRILSEGVFTNTSYSTCSTAQDALASMVGTVCAISVTPAGKTTITASAVMLPIPDLYIRESASGYYFEFSLPLVVSNMPT